MVTARQHDPFDVTRADQALTFEDLHGDRTTDRHPTCRRRCRTTSADHQGRRRASFDLHGACVRGAPTLDDDLVLTRSEVLDRERRRPAVFTVDIDLATCPVTTAV